MPRSAQQQVEDWERKMRALELRKGGATYAAIGKVVYPNMTAASAERAARRLVKLTLEDTLQESADELRRLESERLDALQRALWPAAIAGKWLATDRVLNIMERRAKLFGLDAATVFLHRDEFMQHVADLEAELADLDAELATDPDTSN